MTDKFISFTGGTGLSSLLMIFDKVTVDGAFQMFLYGLIGGMAGLLGKELYNFVKYRIFNADSNSK